MARKNDAYYGGATGINTIIVNNCPNATDRSALKNITITVH